MRRKAPPINSMERKEPPNNQMLVASHYSENLPLISQPVGRKIMRFRKKYMSACVVAGAMIYLVALIEEIADCAPAQAPVAVDASVRKRMSRGPLNPSGAPPVYRFDGVLPTEVHYDDNHDGRMDGWEYYRDGLLLRLEMDKDRDGKVDWRAVFNPPHTVLFEARELNCLYRFMPLRLQMAGGVSPYLYAVQSVEKLVEGEWVGTFEDRFSRCLGAGPADGPIVVKVYCRYEDGKPVVRESLGGISHKHERWEFDNGAVSRYLTGFSKERIHRIRSYKQGQIAIEEYDTDRDQVMDFRGQYNRKPACRKTYSRLIEGKWQGTFELACDPDHQNGHAWYADGLLKKVTSVLLTYS
jgi:hypothetical protein